MRRLVYVLPLAIFVVLAVNFALGLGMDPKIIPSALIDKPVPQFTLPPIEGGAREGLSDTDLKGGISVVNGTARHRSRNARVHSVDPGPNGKLLPK